MIRSRGRIRANLSRLPSCCFNLIRHSTYFIAVWQVSKVWQVRRHRLASLQASAKCAPQVVIQQGG